MEIKIAGNREHFAPLVQDGVQAWIRESGLEKYGRIYRMEIDPDMHHFRADVMLREEKKVVTITVNEYAFRMSDDGEATLEVGKIRSSRKWVEKAIKLFLEGKKLLVPDGPGKYLPLVL